jgi:hypothetical protein
VGGRKDAVTELTEDEEAAIGATVAHLGRQFQGEVPPQELETAIRGCFANWSDARVRDFVPILAERCAREQINQPRQPPD